MSDVVVRGKVYDVFLSYNRSDERFASRLVRALRNRNLTVFFDRDYLTPGYEWPQLLEKRLSDCHAAAICLGPEGLGPWQKREVYVALHRQTREDFRVIPVLLPNALDQPLGFLTLQTWVDFSTGVDDLKALDLLD